MRELLKQSGAEEFRVQEYLKFYIQAAIQCFESYYQYLTEHQRGLIECQVLKIKQEGSHFVLTLRSLLSYADTVQLGSRIRYTHKSKSSRRNIVSKPMS